MLKIRLQRVGRKHEPAFRLVLTDSKNSAQSGKSIEVLGNYDSRRGDKAVINGERVTYWLSQGAQASATVHNLLISQKITTGKKINKQPRKTPPVKEGEAVTASVAEAVAAETPATETQPEAPTEAAPAETAEATA